jgi:hypothetical protein
MGSLGARTKRRTKKKRKVTTFPTRDSQA